MGWLGGWSDNAPNEGSQMTMEQIDMALAEIIQQTGIGQLELVGFDACLMGQVEVLTAITPHARYAVASEETEPALGWAYASFLSALAENPAMSGAELAQTIVETYIAQDYRITNDEARRVLVAEMFGVEEETSAEEAAATLSQDVTLTAVDLAQMRSLHVALNDLAVALATDENPRAVAAARSYAQRYEDVFGKEEDPSYFDLGHLAALAAEESGSAEVQSAAQALLAQIQKTALAEKHGEKRPGSTGFSIYFPDSELYETTFLGDTANYLSVASRFAAASLWDDFLTAFYLGSGMESARADLTVLEPAAPLEGVAIATPPAGVTPVAPAAGGITIEPLELSAAEIPADGSITIDTVVSGDNVAFIYLYVAYYDEESDSWLTADMDFIAADAVKEVGGVTYPDWGEGEIPIQLDWEPTVYFLSDGNEENDQLALFQPQTYGATPEETEYVVYGQYTSAETGKTYEAELVFSGNGEMRALWAYSGSDETAAPRQVFPQPGDTFTIWEKWLEYDANADDWTYNYYEGGVMTFGEQPLTMQPYYAFPGQYQVGIVAVDYDGNPVEEYAEVTVTE
jgi:hypothetical protein